MVLITYVNAEGKAASRTSKLRNPMIRQTYNEFGKMIKEEYLDGSGQPSTNARYQAYHILEYDSENRLIQDTYYNSSGKVSNGKGKYAIIRYTYEADGTRTRTLYSASGRKVG